MDFKVSRSQRFKDKPLAFFSLYLLCLLYSSNPLILLIPFPLKLLSAFK